MTRISPQALALLLGALLWAALSRLLGPDLGFELWTLVAAYLVSWAVLNYALPRGLEVPLSRRKLALVAVLVLTVPLAALARGYGALTAEEGLDGVGRWQQDRLRLERRPAIAPPTLFTDHPQTFYLAADAERADLELGGAAGTLPGEPLGDGLFRVDYDPRRDGLPAGETTRLEVTVVADGRRHARTLRRVRPAAHPRWFCSAPERGLAATVSEETDELFVVGRHGLVHRLAVGDGPSDCAFVAGLVAVAHRYDPRLLLFDPASGAAAGTLTPGPFQHRLATAPGGRVLAVAMRGLMPGVRLFAAGDASANEALVPAGFAALEFPPDWIAFGNRDRLLVSDTPGRDLHLLSRRAGDEADRDGAATASAGTWRESAVMPLGRPAATLARAPGGERFYVALTDYRPDGGTHRGNHFIQDQILTLALDDDGLALIDQQVTARRSPRQDRAGGQDRGISPLGMTARADGSLLVAFTGSDEVWELAPGRQRPRRVVEGPALDLVAPLGVGDLGDGFWAASSPAGGALAIYDADGEMVEFVGVAPKDDDLAAAPEGSLDRQALTLRAGERAFYEATRSGVACQSCHLHADTDHSPHDIGQEPLLPTLTVRGIAGTAPYLRDGSYPRVGDLNDHLALTLYRGYRRFDPGRREALDAYVESLPAPVNPRRFAPRDRERERAGAAAFARARCTLCHTPPAFTNLSQHPVRALFPDYGAELAPTSRLDTPALTALHARSHLLQDGRADDVEAVLGEHNAANRHGDSAALSATERAALAHFLEAL